MSQLFDEFKNVLKNKSIPAFIKYDKEFASYLTASNIYSLVLQRIKQRYRQGLKKGKTLIIIPDPFNAIIDFMACLKLGVSYFPVSPTYFNSTDDFKIIDTNELNLNLREYTPLILNSSGTTNQKTYGLTEKGLLFQLNKHEAFLAQYPHHHKLSSLPLFHCFGFILDYLLAIKMNKYISFMQKPSFFLKDVQKIFFDEHIDFITGVPKQMELLINFAKKDPLLATKLKDCAFYYGGASLPSSLYPSAKETFKNIIEGYGLTEAGPGVLMNGVPIDGVELKINNSKLCIKSPSLAQGIELVDEYYETKDIVEFKNNRFYLLGREDDFIKSSNGTFSHFSEIEKKIYNRFKVDIQIIRRNNKLVPIQLIEEHEVVNKNFWHWLKSNYPLLEAPEIISRIKLYESMEHQNGKSRKDILKAM